MKDNETDQLDLQVKALFDADKSLSGVELGDSRQKNIARVKANVAQRDTMLFAFVKVWTVLADILAPIFAAFATKKASAKHTTNKINHK